MEEFLFPVGIDLEGFAKDLQQIKSAITELQQIAKQSGATISQSFNDAATASTKIVSTSLQATNQIAAQGKAAKDSATQFQSMFDQLLKVGIQNAKSFDITQIAKYFNSIKGGTVALTDLIGKQNQTFDTTKIIAFNEQLSKSKGNFDDLKLTLDFIKNNLGDLSLSPEGTQALTQQITLLETAIGSAAARASEIGINLNNPQGATALNNLQTEVSKTVIDFDALNTAIQDGRKALASIPAGSNEFNTLSTAVSNATTVLNANAASIDQLRVKLSNLEAAKGATGDLSTIALLNQQIDATKEKIGEMEHAGEEGFDNLGKKIQTNATQASTLLIQYRNLRNEIGQLKLTDPTNPKINDLIGQAAVLENTIKNTNRELRLASSNTAGLDAGLQAIQGIVGAFAAAQGAIALFGDKNDELQKTLLKVTAAMSLLQGLQQVGQVIAKESALNVFLEQVFRDKNTLSIEAENKALIEQAVLTGGLTEKEAALSVAEARLAVSEGEAAAGQEELNLAMELNPAGILLLALTALVVGYEVLQNTIFKVAAAEKVRQEVEAKSVDAIGKETAELNLLVATVKDRNLTDTERQNNLDKINTSYPEYLHSLSLENIYTADSSDLITKQIELLKERAFVQAAQDVYVEKLKAVAEAELTLNTIRTSGATTTEKLKAVFTSFGFAMSGAATQEEAVRNATDDLNDKNKEASAALDIFQQGIDGVSKKLNNSLGAFQNYTQQFDIFRQHAQDASNVSPIIQTVQPFNSAQHDADKKAAIDLAQEKVDIATKGTTDEINARRNLLIQQHLFEQKDNRILEEQKKVDAAKFLGDLAAIDNELTQKQLQNATALAQYKITIAEKGSKEELTAQLNAIDAETRQQISAAGIQQGEILKVIADAEKKKQDLRRAFSLQELTNEISLQKAIISAAVDGSQEEFVAKQKIIELSAEQEIISAQNNADKIKEINAKLNDDLFQLLKQHNVQVAESGTNVQIDNIDARLASVERGTEEELKLLEDRNNKEQQLQLITVANSNKNEAEKQADAAKIIAEGNRKNIDLEKQFAQQRIDVELKLQQSLLAIENAQQQNIVDDPLSTDEEKRNAQKTILQNELQDNFDQRAALQQALQNKLIDRKEFEIQYNLLVADGVKIRKKLLDADVADDTQHFTFENFFNQLKAKFIASVTPKGATDKEKAEIQTSWNTLIGDTLGAIGNAIPAAFKAIEDQAQSTIDSIKSVIDETSSQIQDQEEVVRSQQELSNKGLANDLGNQQKLLDDLKAKKAAELKIQEDAQKKLAQIKKEELIIQQASIVASNIETGVDMVSSAAKIFKAHAGIPFAGIAIAVGLVALMLSTFLAIKNSIKAATSTPTFRKGGGMDISGGVITGPSHEQGGVDLVNRKTGKKLAEFEGNEYLFSINKQSTKKYLPLLEAINTNNLPVRNTKEYRSLLNPDSARLPMDRVQQIIILQKEVELHKTYEILDRAELLNIKSEIKNFHKTVTGIDSAKRTYQDFGDFYIITESGRTRKVWKKKR